MSKMYMKTWTTWCCKQKPIKCFIYVGRTPACVKICNSQETISVTWRKERSTVEMNEIMKTAAHRSKSWCWRQFHAADTCSKTRHVPLLCVKTQTSVLKEQHQCTLSTCVKSDVMSTREAVIRCRHVLLRCADSNLNHEWSKTASFVSCLDACLDAVGVRLPLQDCNTHIYQVLCSHLYENLKSHMKMSIYIATKCTSHSIWSWCYLIV
jgi:hypothetical protein